MHHRTNLLLAALLSLAAAPLPAQMKGTLDGSGTNLAFTQAANDPPVTGARTVQVVCGPGVDCARVRLVTRASPDVPWSVVVANGTARFASGRARSSAISASCSSGRSASPPVR